MRYKKGNETLTFNEVDGKANITIMIDGCTIANPTLAQLEEDGWEEIVPVIVPEEEEEEDEPIG